MIVNLRIHKLYLFLQPRDLALRLVLIERLLCHQLAAQILNLQRQLLPNRIVLLPHNVSPNTIEFIQNLGDARLRHLAVVSHPYLLYLFDCFCGYPLICIMILL